MSSGVAIFLKAFVPLLLLFPTYCVAFASSSPSVAASVAAAQRPQPIPITVISGFLGSGKTTLLRHLLQNNAGLKIAVIVNDVASVNIDEKLVVGGTTATTTIGESARSSADHAKPDAVIQLSNGCACCSLSDELLASVSEIVTISDLKDPTERFDHIVIETSGVSDPRAIRGHFQDANVYNMPLMERVQLDTMVTVVDCSTYLDYLKSGKSTNEEDSPELHYRNEGEREKAKEANWMDYLPGTLAEALGDDDSQESSALASGFEGAGVSDLLVEQTEIADVVLLNKIDILDESSDADGRLDEIETIVKSFNPRATVLKTKYATVDRIEEILAVAGGKGVVDAGVVDDHRDYVSAVAPSNRIGDDLQQTSHSHSHSHSHAHSEQDTACTDPDCTDASHNHEHQHNHHNEDEEEKSSSCTDPNCSDPTHTHDHRHNDHNAISYAGIGSFVYRARRPFHPGRLAAFLRHLPIQRGLGSTNDDSEIEPSPEASVAMKCVIRSKGFAWLADSNLAAMYWSHAGSSFEMQCLGRWWATLPRSQWPEEASKDILSDFDSTDHNEEDVEMSTVGDRRQEIVFIGPKLNDPMVQGHICITLGQCLLSDEEWDCYTEQRSNEGVLRAAFNCPLPTKMLSY